MLTDYPAFRLRQAQEAVFKKLVTSWDEATNLPKDVRELLNANCPLEIEAKVVESKDRKSAKALMALSDNNSIETVLMRHEDGRNTVCLSSQVGCSFKCGFCLTAEMGFKRNLTAGEMVDQVLWWERYLKKESQAVTNIVFMGMGEPLLNYDNVFRAIEVMNAPEKLNIGARRISISTSGVTKNIRKLPDRKTQVNLAISLHAPDDELRSRLMSVAKKYPIDKLLDSVGYYIKKTRRRVMIEYIMLRGINDSTEHAKELAKILKQNLKELFFVNLIVYNETGAYQPSRREGVAKFKECLIARGIPVTQRYRFGDDISAACGQLAGSEKGRNSN